MEYNPADLSSILRTLSSFSGNPTSTPTPTSTPPASAPPAPAPKEPPHPDQNRQNANANTKAKNITTWPAALKHIMTLLSTPAPTPTPESNNNNNDNENLQSRISHLIKTQHTHERTWFEGRQALLRKLGERGRKKRELDAVLKSAGVPIPEPHDPTSDTVSTDQTTELAAYDQKVYDASTRMAEALTRELKRLDIPFFALGADLVSNGGETRPGMISTDELVVLQRRMLEVLVDLCGSE